MMRSRSHRLRPAVIDVAARRCRISKVGCCATSLAGNVAAWVGDTLSSANDSSAAAQAEMVRWFPASMRSASRDRILFANRFMTPGWSSLALTQPFTCYGDYSPGSFRGSILDTGATWHDVSCYAAEQEGGEVPAHHDDGTLIIPVKSPLRRPGRTVHLATLGCIH